MGNLVKTKTGGYYNAWRSNSSWWSNGVFPHHPDSKHHDRRRRYAVRGRALGKLHSAHPRARPLPAMRDRGALSGGGHRSGGNRHLDPDLLHHGALEPLKQSNIESLWQCPGVFYF